MATLMFCVFHCRITTFCPLCKLPFCMSITRNDLRLRWPQVPLWNRLCGCRCHVLSHFWRSGAAQGGDVWILGCAGGSVAEIQSIGVFNLLVAGAMGEG
eukprot:5866142-Amphidinium_carterae.1